jgi:hypothetical protein
MLSDRHQMIEPGSCVLLCLWHSAGDAASIPSVTVAGPNWSKQLVPLATQEDDTTLLISSSATGHCPLMLLPLT